MTALDHAKNKLRLAKEIPLLSIIKDLGYSLEDTGSYYSMLSPFRAESKGSLFIDKRRPNKWVDYGNGKRGDSIDFIQGIYPNFGKMEAIDFILNKRNISVSLPAFEPTVKISSNPIEIVSVEALSHPRLIEYLTERKIGLNQAKRYLKQGVIRFPNGKSPTREHLVLAWINNSQGYEFRNSFIKVSNSPKDVTNIGGATDNKNTIGVFEGWPDFLSCLTYYNVSKMRGDAIILNSISFLEVIIPFIKDKTVVYFGQNDTAGNKALKRLREECTDVVDMRNDYYDYKDFNDFLCGKMRKRTKSIKEII